MKKWLLYLVACACCTWTSAASAQLHRGDFRLSLDVDMISIGHVKIEDDGGDREALVFGIGPNQLGPSLLNSVAVMTPVGLGLAWVLTPKLLLGFRAGFGFDLIDPDGGTKTRVLAFSIAPGIEFVPIGHRAKLFIAARPLFQANRLKVGDFSERVLLGGFSTGIGTYIFPSSSVSADIGFFFEGRFGNYRDENDDDFHIRDLRGVVRFGLSLWR